MVAAVSLLAVACVRGGACLDQAPFGEVDAEDEDLCFLLVVFFFPFCALVELDGGRDVPFWRAIWALNVVLSTGGVGYAMLWQSVSWAEDLSGLWLFRVFWWFLFAFLVTCIIDQIN